MPLPALPPFATLRAFEMVGRTGGIRKAAVQLGISHAIVSRHLAALEQHLGVTLLNRRTGELSEAGLRYHARVSAAIAELAAATAQFTGSAARPLTIWCSAGFSLHWLAARLSSFQGGRSLPAVDLRSTDAEPAFDRDEADGDIRYLTDSDARAQPIGVRGEVLARPDVFPVASPAFLAALPAPFRTRADLLALPLVHEGTGQEWANWLAAQGLFTSPSKAAGARFGQAHLALMAARSGQGVALANRFLVQDDLARGSLVVISPADEPWEAVQLGSYCFRSASARWSDPSILRFRRWLKKTMAASTPQPGHPSN
jgi:DNA-binding transcriptional LysR family regulator